MDIWDALEEAERNAPLRLPEGFCGMEGVEELDRLEREEAHGCRRGPSLDNASTSDLLRALADRLAERLEER